MFNAIDVRTPRRQTFGYWQRAAFVAIAHLHNRYSLLASHCLGLAWHGLACRTEALCKHILLSIFKCFQTCGSKIWVCTFLSCFYCSILFMLSIWIEIDCSSALQPSRYFIHSVVFSFCSNVNVFYVSIRLCVCICRKIKTTCSDDKSVSRMSLSRHHNSSIRIEKNCACSINHREVVGLRANTQPYAIVIIIIIIAVWRLG